MATLCDPRAAGFNYGLGWGPTPKPPIYQKAQEIARRLGEAATKASDEAWRLEMAIRNVRLAETLEEKRATVAALSLLVAKYYPPTILAPLKM